MRLTESPHASNGRVDRDTGRYTCVTTWPAQHWRSGAPDARPIGCLDSCPESSRPLSMQSLGKPRPERVTAADVASDADLVVRIQAGDERAFEALFRAHAGALCRLAYHYLQSTALAEEVVQDVLLRVWERRATLVVRESLRAYLHAAVRNRALDAIKATRSAARTHAAGQAADDQSAVGMGEAARSPSEDVERQELAVALRNAVGRLPEQCRLVFILRWESHLSYAEVAEVLHISVKAVERRRQRGLERLAKSLRGFFP